ncbi:conserved hypothetical integral membrane protein TIGR02206 [Oceanobacillus limi]|uniref:Conserved hypothetical integral membrane protein TIGR02206 n=1 Tax=Oceanobacillus limi TaxID=930131 RepID=A0A1I0HJE3_9BACI|nr:TIGR02206 family membrane protein [Oceanobacillus limi]SET83235.1 conserved hypothetical integral membrane protein TIGR02206 [Oceanobacillus limi]
MKDWFASNSNQPFELFHISHIIIILIYMIGITLTIISSQQASKRKKESIRWIFFCILILSESSYQLWGLFNGMWNTREFLPFQLCSISGIVAIISLLTRNVKLIQILYFIGIIPPLLAVVTPELFHAYPHFRFWQFFTHHIVLSCATLFLVTSSNVTISFRTTIESYSYLLIYAAITGFILNPLFDANFLFLARPGSASTPLGLLGNNTWYYINLCLLGFIVFLFMFGIYKIFRKKS